MRRAVLLILLSPALFAQPRADSPDILHRQRSSPGDLEVAVELTHAPARSTRYIRYQDLLRMPQETYTVSDDSNLSAKTVIGGVALETLARLLGQSPESFIVAICDDQYQAHYPRDYVAAHHPLLVLRINGQLHDHWPPSQEGGQLGPYLISHPSFKPAFKVLSYDDEPQVPYGVVGIEFHRETAVFGAIQPGAKWRENEKVQQGYLIARQDCLRCHNMGAEGGTKAGRSWLKLAARAKDDGSRFKQTIRNPASVTPGAQMPAHSGYDDATLDALTAYFKIFLSYGDVK
jgi:mono/diheme cytochrome c family protein